MTDPRSRGAEKKLSKLGGGIIAAVLLFSASILSYNTYLTDRDYKLIAQNLEYYLLAAATCDVPVEMIIAIHYRESYLRRGYYASKRKVVVNNIGGPFMLDCGGEGTPDFEANIRFEEKRIAKLYNYNPDARVSSDFAFACLVAAHYIKIKARFDLSTEHGVADTFWGYNGRAHKSCRDSAYVYSDPLNGNTMTLTFNGKTFVDRNAGTFVIWRELISDPRF